MSNESRLALVTGASRGIGRAIALELASQGLTVIGTATSENGAERISQYFSDANLSGTGMQLDVSSAESIDQLMEKIKAVYGESVDVLVNNAAITGDNILMRMKQEEWDNIINTDMTSVFRLSQKMLRPMMKKRWGRIVSIGSVVGSIGNPGQANYAAAKAGVIGFTKSLAREIASRGITVNVVSPGFIDTDMTKELAESQREVLQAQIPAARLGQPEDIAKAVAFLCGEHASYITGETLHVNGGMYMA
ncbi:MAG: 3-oxoacyl-ACP reductase [Gammaproteobacteria bacterium CG22_combo_CG10-13_8_21_14_all_40_8]|nr:MAG: 3-oxoacyl-ACP reductase [Gammaproteobacteria bacterium CG22_combo_CG10-13_8_21_14_all_40_8]